MQAINLPEFTPLLKNSGQRKYIFDSFRKKFVTLTPEEWVRQHWLNFLVNFKAVPKGGVGVEVALKYNEMSKRADIVVFNKSQKPALIVECKAPHIELSEQTCMQIAHYNAVFKARFLIVSNGIQHFLFEVDFDANDYKRLTELPDYGAW